VPEPQPQPYVPVHEPDLVPPPDIMAWEGIHVLEDWFRWSEEWSVLLRIYGKLACDSSVLEIGCGLGQIAYALRWMLTDQGRYEGFDVVKRNIDFLQGGFQRHMPNFQFTWANLHNTYYNPEGEVRPWEYRFPFGDEEFDVVYAASVFTHMLPRTAAHYVSETARVLRPGGRAVFSFFLLDNYRPAAQRAPGMFSDPDFNFDTPYEDYGDAFRANLQEDPEYMTAYRADLVEQFATSAGLAVAEPPLPGMWSGRKHWIGTHDLVILEKPREPEAPAPDR
jgi:SAM-dependent methyltransferase